MFARVLGALLHAVEFASTAVLAVVAVTVAVATGIIDAGRAIGSLARSKAA